MFVFEKKRKLGAWMTILAACLLAPVLAAQTNTGILRGQVTDPSGGAVPGATLLLTAPSGDSFDTTANKEGNYEFRNLQIGRAHV